MKDRLDSNGLLHFWEKIKEKIPTKTSDIDNDSGFITSADIPTGLSDFTDDVHGLFPFLGTNPVNPQSNDTPTTWKNLGRGYAWYNTDNLLVGQPYRWGVLLNYTPEDTTDVFQIWGHTDGGMWWRSGYQDTVWDSSSWKKLALASDIPIVPKYVDNTAPDETYTAAQVLAYGQANAAKIFIWSRYADATYTPVDPDSWSGGDFWVYTLYAPSNYSAYYVVFEAQNTRTGNVFRCKQDGTWETVFREKDLYYQAGDTFTISGTIPALITNGTKDLCLLVPVDKSLAKISTITVSSVKGGVRVPSGGYLDGGSDSQVWAPSSTYTVAQMIRTDRTIGFRLRKGSVFTNATNNTPATFFANPITFTFS